MAVRVTESESGAARAAGVAAGAGAAAAAVAVAPAAEKKPSLKLYESERYPYDDLKNSAGSEMICSFYDEKTGHSRVIIYDVSNAHRAPKYVKPETKSKYVKPEQRSKKNPKRTVAGAEANAVTVAGPSVLSQWHPEWSAEFKRMYWWNRQAPETTWFDPNIEKEAPWRVIWSAEHECKYWWNTQTCETTWENPNREQAQARGAVVVAAAAEEPYTVPVIKEIPLMNEKITKVVPFHNATALIITNKGDFFVINKDGAITRVTKNPLLEHITYDGVRRNGVCLQNQPYYVKPISTRPNQFFLWHSIGARTNMEGELKFQIFHCEIQEMPNEETRLKVLGSFEHDWVLNDIRIGNYDNQDSVILTKKNDVYVLPLSDTANGLSLEETTRLRQRYHRLKGVPSYITSGRDEIIFFLKNEKGVEHHNIESGEVTIEPLSKGLRREQKSAIIDRVPGATNLFFSATGYLDPVGPPRVIELPGFQTMGGERKHLRSFFDEQRTLWCVYIMMRMGCTRSAAVIAFPAMPTLPQFEESDILQEKNTAQQTTKQKCDQNTPSTWDSLGRDIKTELIQGIIRNGSLTLGETVRFCSISKSWLRAAKHEASLNNWFRAPTEDELDLRCIVPKMSPTILEGNTFAPTLDCVTN